MKYRYFLGETFLSSMIIYLVSYGIPYQWLAMHWIGKERNKSAEILIIINKISLKSLGYLSSAVYVVLS